MKVEYHDLAKPEEREKAEDVIEAVSKNRVPYPLVAINGEFKIAGAVDFWRISSIVDEMLKAGATA